MKSQVQHRKTQFSLLLTLPWSWGQGDPGPVCGGLPFLCSALAGQSDPGPVCGGLELLRWRVRATLSATGEACGVERSRVSASVARLCSGLPALRPALWAHRCKPLHRSGRASPCAREQPSVRVALLRS